MLPDSLLSTVVLSPLVSVVIDVWTEELPFEETETLVSLLLLTVLDDKKTAGKSVKAKSLDFMTGKV